MLAEPKGRTVSKGGALFFFLCFPGLTGSAQAQNCSFTVTPTTINVAAAESTGRVEITASNSTCQWVAVANVAWITISFGGVPGNPSTGNGTTGFRVAANRDAQPRSGTINVAGTLVNIRQEAANCPFTLNPVSAIVTPGGGSASFALQTTCNWTATSNNEWITLTAPVSGSGNGTVRYTVSANNTGSTRNGTITVGNQQFRISQPAPSCAITIAPASVNILAGGGTGSIQVTAACSWTAVASAPWVTITSGASGTSNGTVAYSVAANNTTAVRTATITVSTQTFQISQAPANCAISISPTSASFPAEGGQSRVTVESTCDWQVSTRDSWITITSPSTGSNNGAVTYSVAANTGANARTGSVQVGAVSLTVAQSAAGCAITLSPAGASIASSGGTGTILVSAPACRWAATLPFGVNWIALEPDNGEGPGLIRYTAAANNSPNERVAAITVGGQMFTVRQAGRSGAAVPSFASSGVVNAASFQGGPVAPGLIVTIFGTAIGPAELVTYQLTPDGYRFSDTLGGTRVLFDGVAAPLIYVTATQVSAIVPYAVAGKESTVAQIEVNGVRSAEVTIPVVAALPGLFTLNQSGSGPGALLNQDFTVNSAANPAKRGSVVQLFATGAGLINPPTADGLLTTALSRTILPVTVEIGGRVAEVLYAGTAPTLVSGLVQINAVVPADAPVGPAVSLLVRVGATASQSGVTLSVVE